MVYRRITGGRTKQDGGGSPWGSLDTELMGIISSHLHTTENDRKKRMMNFTVHSSYDIFLR